MKRSDSSGRTRDRNGHDPDRDVHGQWVSAVFAFLGLWIVLWAVLADFTAAQFWNDVLTGCLLIAVGACIYVRGVATRSGRAATIVAVIAGMWLVASPFVLGVRSGPVEVENALGIWNDMAVGLLAVLFGSYATYESSRLRSGSGEFAER